MSEIKDRVLAHLSPETWCKYNATVDTEGPKAGKCCLNGHLVIAGEMLEEGKRLGKLVKFERNDSSIYSGDDFYVNPTEVQTVS